MTFYNYAMYIVGCKGVQREIFIFIVKSKIEINEML